MINENILNKILLNLLMVVPAILLISNLAPSIWGFKIHQIVNGIIVLISIILLFIKNTALTILLLWFYFMQKVVNNNNISDYLDNWGGLITILVLLNAKNKDLINNDKIKLFFILTSIPLVIAILQIFNILPYNAGAYYSQENYTRWFGDIVIRPSGYLYHPYDLVIFACFFYLFLLFRYKKTSLLLLGAANIILIKLKAGIVLFLVLYLYIVRKKTKYYTYIYILGAIIIYFVVTKIGIFEITTLFQIDKLKEFNSQLFTGRLFIWNILIDNYIDASFLIKVIGFGAEGARNIIFSDYRWKSLFLPGAHNAILDILITNGIIGLFIYFYLFFKFIKLIHEIDTNKKISHIVIIIVVILGLTGPIFSSFYFWIATYFLAVYNPEYNAKINIEKGMR
ncbi:MAG: hypothetical protein Kow0037_14610 [Calditrichia bacterium]